VVIAGAENVARVAKGKATALQSLRYCFQMPWLFSRCLLYTILNTLEWPKGLSI
jgi:hypothetical protein